MTLSGLIEALKELLDDQGDMEVRATNGVLTWEINEGEPATVDCEEGPSEVLITLVGKGEF